MAHHEHQHKDHGPHHEVKSELSFDEKLIKLLDHWLKHNEDHAGTYRDWAEKARQNRLGGVATLLEEVSELTAEISARFEAAAEQMQDRN